VYGLEKGKYLYLYGIVESRGNESFGNMGIGNSQVYTVQYEDVGAVVSDIPKDYEISVQEALTHEKVLRKVMETHAVIPVSFGAVAKNESEILNILKRARMMLKNILERIRDKVQVNVKISWGKGILADILKEDEEIRILSAELKQKNDDHALRIELGRRIKSALDKRGNTYLKEIHSVLGELSCAFKENKITDQDTIMNASFLINRKREQEFYKKIEELERKHHEKLKVLAVGPLPPYNFTQVDIKRMDFNMVEEARKALGLGQEISISEVRAAYNLQTQKHHPDLHPNDPVAQEKFKKIKNAHDMLTKYCEHYLCSLEKSKVEENILIVESGG
jgi:hypothetical protein